MQQKSLVLILARDLADKLASAVLLVDGDGTLVYFNELAGEILGQSFGEVGEVPMEEWAKSFTALDFSGTPVPFEQLPLVRTLKDHAPHHSAFRIKTPAGDMRDIAVTALPFFARSDELVGAAAIFWDHNPAEPSVLANVEDPPQRAAGT